MINSRNILDTGRSTKVKVPDLNQRVLIIK